MAFALCSPVIKTRIFPFGRTNLCLIFAIVPIFGSSFLIEKGVFRGIYPHNLILESLMATGLIGTCFLIRWLYGLFKTGYTVIVTKDIYAWIPLLFFQYFIFGMFSKSIYANTNLWYFAFLLLYLNAKRKKDVYVKN